MSGWASAPPIAGEALRKRLAARLAKHEMVSEIRGLGLLSAIEFKAPRRFRLRVPFQAFARVHPAMFGQLVVMRLFRDHGILSQICGNNFMVLKVAPPLIVNDAQLAHYVEAIGAVVDLMHSSASFWSEALQLAGRVMTSI
jgi:ornithine--oxo-acid transaminase